METPFSWSWSILPVLLCLGVAARGKPVAPPLSAPNPLPPSEVKCISNAAWSTPDFLPKNCYTTLARFHGRMIDEHGLMVPHEFLAPGTRGTTIFPQVKTPRKYYYRKSGIDCSALVLVRDGDSTELITRVTHAQSLALWPS